MKSYVKQFGCKAVVVAGAAITPEMLAKINGFALKELTAEDVYVRKFLLCHSAVDRDRERFPESILQDFVATIPGKSLLAVHDRRSLPLGLWFDATTEQMSLEQFKALTGVDATVPEGQTVISVMWAWSYMLNKDFNAPIIENMDGGVYRHVSIGFAAADIVAIKKDANGPTLYYEYVGPGEAQEGSLVWLGAQPGATTQKQLEDQLEDPKKEKGAPTMKLIIATLLGLGKTLAPEATEDQVVASLKTVIDEKDATITALKAESELGRAYKDKTIAGYVALKHKLGEVGDTPEEQTNLKSVAAGLPFSFLENEVKSLEARAAKAFPVKGQLDGDDRRDKSADGGVDTASTKHLALVAG